MSLLTFKLSSVLALSGLLFAVGAYGVLARRNIMLMLISVEIMLNAVMLAFVAFARYWAGHAPVAGKEYAGETGQIFALFIIAVAAAEAAVGLAIVIAFFRNKPTVDTRDMQQMKN